MNHLTHNVSRVALAWLLSLPAAFLIASNNALALDEITVTARKTSENLQEVPLAITAIGSDDIDRLGIKDLADLSQQDTSVQFDEGFTPSDTRITIRGLSPTRGRPNAATLIDGIDISSEAVSNAGGSLLIDPRLVDVERIEVVKGPQSALYGRSAFAGAIQYVSKDPDDVLGGEVFVDGNIEGDKSVRGNVSIPLTDTMGIRLNGLAWDNEGYYRSAVTGERVGGGDGAGGTLTFVYEPTDEVKVKWRTDFSENNYDTAAQSLLHDWGTQFDLGSSGGLDPSVSNLAPMTSECTGGFIQNNACGLPRQIIALLSDPSIDPAYEAYGPPGVGPFDPTDDVSRNLYNKQVQVIGYGTVPDGKYAPILLSPDYRKLQNGDEANARMFEGSSLTVFRTSLVADWEVSDSLTLTSYSAYTDATDDTEVDLGKYFVDECRSTAPAGGNPLYFGTECGPGMGDGINDARAIFAQDSITNTKQLSQEFRAAWDINDAVNFTTGLNFWQEQVRQNELNLTLFSGGPQCFLRQPDPDDEDTFEDASTGAFGAFLGLDPVRDLCGDTFLPTAFFANEVFQERQNNPSQQRRTTDHYSWYGALDMQMNDRFSTTLEWRFSKEDNTVTSATQTTCIDPNDLVSDGMGGYERDPETGQLLCNGPKFPTRLGPSGVFPCGQGIGRCETIAQAPDGISWSPYGLGGQFGFPSTLERSDRIFAPKVTLEYILTDNVNTYFSWSRGIKPGGFSLLTSGAFGLDANGDGVYDEVAFDPERLDVWELGAKTDLFDGKVRLNGAVYYQDFKDKQVSVQEVVGGTVGTRIRNVSGSEIYGMELDGTWQATDNLRLQAGYTYTDSEYTDYTVLSSSANDIIRTELGNGQGCISLAAQADGSPACVLSYNGNDLERAPRNAFLLNANYTNNLMDTGKEWYGEVNFRYQSSRWLEQYNIVELPAYTRTNMSLGIIADNWDAQLYVSNVFDDDTPITGGANPGLVTGSFAFGIRFPLDVLDVSAGPKLPSDIYISQPDPRIIGARIRYQFGG